MALPVADTRGAADWVFQVMGPEELHLPGLHLPGVRLQRLAVGPHDLQVEVWLAPSLDYIPVRLRLAWGAGDWLEQQWVPADAR